MISVYSRKTQIELSLRRQEAMDRYVKLLQWGRANPTRFIENIFKIQLLDYQKYVFLNTWTAETAAWVMSRNAAKSFLGGLYMMTRALLFPSSNIYIMSTVASQSRDTFMKLENIAKKNISSVIGSSDVFVNEVTKNTANTDGFLHDKTSCQVSLFSGSSIISLSGDAKSIVGKRSALNFYDEAGKIDAEFISLTLPFLSQDSNFKTGEGFDSRVYPPNIKNQAIFASSAEGVDTVLYEKYKDCAKKMLMGIPGYFAADISCDIPLAPTLGGKQYAPLLKRTEIDDMMRSNPDRAAREYYNIFDRAGGSDSVVSRSIILRNEHRYLPTPCSEGVDKKYVLAYDPALQADNSFILIGELYRDPEKGLKMRIVNGINLIEKLGPTDKRPLRTTEQVEWVRKLLLLYNGNALDYKNIKLRIDAGAGGHGRAIADILMLPWHDQNGRSHIGIWDSKDETEAYRNMHNDKYPEADDCLDLVEPRKCRTQLFTDLGAMMSEDLIDLPEDMPNNGEWDIDGVTKTLTGEELRALLEIDLMKQEIMTMQKIKTAAGNVTFQLPPAKQKTMHDDRAYCAALLAGYLADLRRAEQAATEKPKQDYLSYLKSRCAQGSNNKQVINPFAGLSNPFKR